MTINVLKIHAGRPSLLSMQAAIAGFYYDPVPDHVDLLGTGLTLKTLSGADQWVMGYPTIKNGGVWSDPAAADGRKLIQGRAANVRETFELTLSANQAAARYAHISRLNEIGRIARAYWSESSEQRPVYLELQTANGLASQFSTVFDIQVAVNGSPYETGDPMDVTLVIEREPFWRVVPPGFSGGSISGSPYVVYSTSGNVAGYDERGTANVNWIDIAAANIPGDMEALTEINVYYFGGVSLPGGSWPIMVSRSTQRDLNPSNNVVRPVAEDYQSGPPRLRNTLNAGDAGFSGSWGIVAGAAGLLSNGSTVNRYVARHNTAAVAVDHFLSWNMRAELYARRFAVFVRGNLVTGATGSVNIRLDAIQNGSASLIARTPTVTPPPGFSTTYLGILDLSNAGMAFRNFGYMNASGVIYMRLFLNKPAAVLTDFHVLDVVLMPIDEPNVLVTPPNYAEMLAIDSAHVRYGPRVDFAAQWGGSTIGGNTFPYRGGPLTLVPNVNNRLYFLPLWAAENVLARYQVAVYVYPRWQGLRTK